MIDEKIQGNYKLHDSNLIAAGQLENMSEQQQRQFESRFSGLTDAEKAIAITSYAKPYFNQQQYSQNNTQENSDG